MFTLLSLDRKQQKQKWNRKKKTLLILWIPILLSLWVNLWLVVFIIFTGSWSFQFWLCCWFCRWCKPGLYNDHNSHRFTVRRINVLIMVEELTLCAFPLLFLSAARSGISDLLGFEARPIDDGTRSSLGTAFFITPPLSPRSPRPVGFAWLDTVAPVSVAALLKMFKILLYMMYRIS